MKRIIHWFAPKEQEFFSLLAEQSSHALEAIKELKAFIAEYHDLERLQRKEKAQAIKAIEEKADSIKSMLLERLDKSSNPPIGKEDLRKLSIILEDVTNLINSISSKFVVLSIERIDPYITNFVDLNIEIIIEINKIILNLNKLKGIEEHYSKITELEKSIDLIYQEALSELYHFYKNSIDIMKYREIYELFEQIADKCKDLANAAKSIIAKHS